MRRERPLALLAIVLTAAASDAQQTKVPTQSGSLATTPNAAVVSRIAAQQFEQGLSVILADPNTHAIGPAHAFMQGVSLTWKAYPGITHYRVQRSVQSAGPWVTIHDATGAGDGIGGLPPDMSFYMRVLALEDRGKAGLVVADSSSPVQIHTAPAFAPNGNVEVRMHPCLGAGAGQVVLVWAPVPGLMKYVMTPYAVPIQGSSVQANIMVGAPGTPIVVYDTTAVVSVGQGSRVVFRVQGRADFANWPVNGQTMTMLTPMPVNPSSTGYAVVQQSYVGLMKCE